MFDSVVCFRSTAVLFFAYTFNFPSFWYKLYQIILLPTTKVLGLMLISYYFIFIIIIIYYLLFFLRIRWLFPSLASTFLCTSPWEFQRETTEYMFKMLINSKFFMCWICRKIMRCAAHLVVTLHVNQFSNYSGGSENVGLCIEMAIIHKRSV